MGGVVALYKGPVSAMAGSGCGRNRCGPDLFRFSSSLGCLERLSFAKTCSGGLAVDLSARIQKQFRPMVTTRLHLLRLFPFLCGSHRQLALENVALLIDQDGSPWFGTNVEPAGRRYADLHQGVRRPARPCLHRSPHTETTHAHGTGCLEPEAR